MMTFNALHKDLDCDCLADSGIVENTSDTFVRWVKAAPPVLDDFDSMHELGAQPKKNDCDNLCRLRGVSINIANQESEPVIKAQWAEYTRFRPRLPRTFCKFKLKSGAGKVWKTPTKTFPYHYELLKSDQFCMEMINLIEVSPI
jgi:hypothetical protein